MKQAFTSPPKKGKVKAAGHDMGGMFGRGNPKKSEADNNPQTRAGERSARRMRLANKFI